MAGWSNKKSVLIPLDQGCFLFDADGEIVYAIDVLIPLDQGCFLFITKMTATKRLTRLNPFGSGMFFICKEPHIIGDCHES